MTSDPPRISNQRMFLDKNLPKNVAEAPKVIKISENPRMNIKELIITFVRIFFRLSPAESSSKEIPVIKAKYDGIRGRIQGERKEMIPADKATKIEIFSDPGMNHFSSAN